MTSPRSPEPSSPREKESKTGSDGPGAASSRSRPARRPSGFSVVTASLAVFLALLGGLSWRLASGQDPALGAGEPAVAATAKVKRPVVHRKVVKVRVVEEPKPTATAPAPAAVSTPAPAPAPAPAPPPAPAQPVTQSS